MGKTKSFTDFLDVLEENASLPRKERKRLADAILVDFINFCKDKGLSNNTIRTYVASVQNFLKYKGFPLSTRWLGNMPRSVPQRSNRKHQWKLSHIKEFVERATTYRDKAIILVLFQSGIGARAKAILCHPMSSPFSGELFASMMKIRSSAQSE